MASTSASSVQKSFKYDVFLSFRGEDTRKNFVDHLYHALKRNGIYTYRDDEEIKKGGRISDELLRSIEDSKFYIIVFSKNYASSSWCLDELVKIMECQKTDEHTAYPVFYDVEPTEVRKQSGAVEEAFAKHKENESAQEWRDALKEAANLAGWELKNTCDGHEAQFIQEIVRKISLFITSSVVEKLIGMETRVENFIKSLKTDVDDVRFIGIRGMGGIGKTTLARVVFDQMSFQFEGSSFVENVRERSQGSMINLTSLQKQVVSEILKTQDVTINGVHDGKNMIKQRMGGIKVLIVLDDVDNISQLEALADELNWFKAGSRIIITTRDKQVLNAHGVPDDLILNVNLLSNEEANCLFNRYAFGTVIPNQGYEELAGQVIRYAAGLPLTIKVLGSFLGKQDESVWADALERLKTIPLEATQDILKLSYESLEVDQKEIFLDVSCMLKGWQKEDAIIALKSRGFQAKIGLKILELKSLITVTDLERLDMHDHLVEMGQNIIRCSHPNEPYKHSRLWIQEEIEDILVKNKDTEATTCVNVHLIDPRVLKDLKKMTQLKFLNVTSHPSQIDDGKLYLPNSLQYLGWSYYPFRCLPKNFEANDLVALKMIGGHIEQPWKMGEREDLKKLRFIDMKLCKLRSLDIGLMPNLEKASLVFCEELIELYIPIQNSKLTYLNLCRVKLRTLYLEHAHNLQELKVEGCKELRELRLPIESQLKRLTVSYCDYLETLDHLIRLSQNLETLTLCGGLFAELHLSAKLKRLTLVCCRLKTLNLTETLDLETLDLTKCEDLLELHMPIECFELKTIRVHFSNLTTLDLRGTRNLEILDLEECSNLVEFHMSTENLKLKTIKIPCSTFRTLNLMGTRHVDTLNIEQCEDLVDHLPIESPELETINIRCFKLITLNLTHTQNIRSLNLVHCEDLVELHMPTECPELKAIRCSQLTSLDLTGNRNLERLDLEKCEDLIRLQMPVESPKLKVININCSKLAILNLGMSPHLECLDLLDCFALEEISAPIGCLGGFVRFKPFLINPGSPELYLKARSIGKCTLHPDNNLPVFCFECVYRELLPLSTRNLEKLITFSLCPCTNLVSLSERICGGLQRLRKLTLANDILEVPNEIEQLECLEELTLKSTKIEYLPDRICALEHLKLLQLESCRFLMWLPEDIGRLECLEELHLTDCTSLRIIPNSICNMQRLKCFNLRNCNRLENLPKEMGRLTRLKELNIQGTSIIDLPESIYQLEDLRFCLD